jgi:putative SOS response-associated peptidase YedK
MCGRFTLTVHQLDDVVERLSAVVDPDAAASYRPRYNIAPSDAHWMLRSKEGRRELLPAYWGLVNHWATDPSVGMKQINARAETLSERPAFRDAFRSRRCVIPADGFFEWRGPKGKREPLWFHAAEGELLLFGGLYEGWRDPETAAFRRTFTIVTTGANDLVRPIHDRMPLILPASSVEAWLTGNEPEALLLPAGPGVLGVRPASPRANGTDHDDPGLLDADDPLVPRQLHLF